MASEPQVPQGTRLAEQKYTAVGHVPKLLRHSLEASQTSSSGPSLGDLGSHGKRSAAPVRMRDGMWLVEGGGGGNITVLKYEPRGLGLVGTRRIAFSDLILHDALLAEADAGFFFVRIAEIPSRSVE